MIELPYEFRIKESASEKNKLIKMYFLSELKVNGILWVALCSQKDVLGVPIPDTYEFDLI